MKFCFAVVFISFLEAVECIEWFGVQNQRGVRVSVHLWNWPRESFSTFNLHTGFYMVSDRVKSQRKYRIPSHPGFILYYCTHSQIQL